MSDWREMQTNFRLIAALAEKMATSHTRPWVSDIQAAVSQITRAAAEISQNARQFEAGDR